jgi:hypothetical protein
VTPTLPEIPGPNIGQVILAKAGCTRMYWGRYSPVGLPLQVGRGFGRFWEKTIALRPIGRSAAALFVPKLGFTLFKEGGHALFLVFGGEQRMEHPAFKQQTFAQWHLIGAVHGLFDDHHRDH